MKNTKKTSKKLQKLVGFEPMSKAETEKVVGGDIKDFFKKLAFWKRK